MASFSATCTKIEKRPFRRSKSCQSPPTPSGMTFTLSPSNTFRCPASKRKGSKVGFASFAHFFSASTYKLNVAPNEHGSDNGPATFAVILSNSLQTNNHDTVSTPIFFCMKNIKICVNYQSIWCYDWVSGVSCDQFRKLNFGDRSVNLS